MPGVVNGLATVALGGHFSASAKEICQQRSEVYEAARQANPTRWSRSIRCWLQPKEMWINKPPEENELALELTLMQAAIVAAQE